MKQYEASQQQAQELFELYNSINQQPYQQQETPLELNGIPNRELSWGEFLELRKRQREYFQENFEDPWPSDTLSEFTPPDRFKLSS